MEHIPINKKNKGLLNYISSSEKIYTKVISPNFELKYNVSVEEPRKRLRKIIRYSGPDSKKETLFIWPEGVFTGYNYEELNRFKHLIKNNFSKKHLIMFGVNTFNDETDEYFNSLVVINNDFKILYKYDKKISSFWRIFTI